MQAKWGDAGGGQRHQWESIRRGSCGDLAECQASYSPWPCMNWGKGEVTEWGPGCMGAPVALAWDLEGGGGKLGVLLARIE